jgi:protein O-mannosyl-transferase
MLFDIVQSHKKTAFLTLVLIILGFITYSSSFKNEFVWDDDYFISQNINVRSLKNIPQMFITNTVAGAGTSSNYYRPVMTLTFALDHAVWGNNVFGYHLTNTLLHIFAAIILFLWLKSLEMKKMMAFALAVIFIVHPIQTEAITYLSSRGDPLYSLFLLLSVYLFTISLYKNRPKLLIPAIIFFPLSLLSKEAAIASFPMYTGILFIFKFKKKLSLSKLHDRFASHFVVVLSIILITIIYFGLRLTFLNFNNSLNYSGANDLYGTNFLVRMYTFLKVLLIDIRLILYPYPLYLERTTSIITSTFSPWVIGSFFIILLTIFAGVYETIKKRTCWILLGLLIISTQLLPVSGIIPQTGLIRENWLYLPMVGFYLILMAGFINFLPHLTRKFRKLFPMILIILSMLYVGMTVNHNFDWRDNITYFEYSLRFTNTARLHLNLGSAYIGKKNFTRAKEHLEKAIRMADIYPQAHYNLGIVENKLKNDKLAEQEFLKSLNLDPSYLYVYPLLINLYLKQYRYDRALHYVDRLVSIYPNDYKMIYLEGEILYKSGQLKSAEIMFKRALTISHTDPALEKIITHLKTGYPLCSVTP